MKIVISSEGPKPTDRIDPRFGRARYLLLFDSESDTFVAEDNSERAQAAQGVGVQTAQKVVAFGAEALLTGHCGPKAYEVLQTAGVKIYSGLEGIVLDAVNSWKAGNLEPLSAPDGVGRH